jgi:hypothetical protein
MLCYNDRPHSMDPSVRVIVQQFLNKLPDPIVRAQLADIIRLSIVALEGLMSLDDSVYNYFADVSAWGEKAEINESEREALLRRIHDGTFGGMNRLVQTLQASKLLQLSEVPAHGDSAPPDSRGFDDWDFEVQAPTKSARPRLPTLNEIDIERAFGFVTGDEHVAARLEEYQTEAKSVALVLCKDFRSAESRITGAFARRQLDLVLRELDTTRESLSEGVFAMLLMTFHHFWGDEGKIDRSVLLPGYKNELEKALTIRRGLADLRRVVTAENDWIIQDEKLARKVHYESITTLAEQLKAFDDSEAFRFMRAPDRLELSRFLNTITMGSYREAVQACEGLSRYLESLSIINQREVLQQHDQEVLRDIDGSLDAARSIITVSLSGTKAMVKQALHQASRIYGRNGMLDEQIASWDADPGLFETAEGLESVIEQMHELAR